MITKIIIQDYRSCINTTFELQDDLSVLIGPNSSGKTNILNAIQLLQKLTDDARYRRREDFQLTNQCKLKVWFSINEKKVILTALVDVYTDENNEDSIVSSQQSWYLKDFTGNGRRLKLSLSEARSVDFNYYHGFNTRNKYYHYTRQKQLYVNWKSMFNREEVIGFEIIGRISKELSEMRYYSASRFTNPSSCPVSFEIEKEGKKSRGIRLKGHTKFLYDLFNLYIKEKRWKIY